MSKRIYFSSSLLVLLVISAIFVPILSSFDPQYVDLSQKLLAPNNVHLLGTDQLGRDVLSRLLYGARYSLFLAIIISLLELTIGMFVGLIVGWYQGKLENLFLWIANIILAFPSFLLSLATVGILGHGLGNLIFAIVFVEWVYYAKLMTNLVKSAKKEPYVINAQIMGLSVWHILRKHIFPFVYQPILVMVLMNIGNIILMISGFSFLGIGVQPNITEWGMMLHDARGYFRTATWMMLSPGIAIFLTVFSFNTLGDAIDKKDWKRQWNS
ncbi:ABC transporter permease [Streptococcus agalactiae]|uniref:ABC transporter permease n=1 Tax=Streptococcus agalactiae TaxID=1311 RepID=UPI0005E0188B|nr:ABC transporter permease [Streptococcus agalactiae]CNI91516.1 Oligopeptide transport system permease protein oppC2 [Streptococcus agalactiae]